MLCVVFEKAVPFFNPSGTYTGDFVSPWGPTECAGEMHDTFQISTMTFNGNRDGYFEGGFGARRTNNYDLFSFPNDGVAFLYHFSIFAVSDPTTELVNINSASLQGTSNPTKGGAQCAATNTGAYCMNFGFMGACSDSLFFETMTIAPATGSYEADAYWASSTYERWQGDIHPAQNGWTLPSEGYESWLSHAMPPLPPGVSYPARRLAELTSGDLTQKELREHRMRIIEKDSWLQSMIPQYGGTLGWSNHSLVKLLEDYEFDGKSVADKYLHALIPRPPPMPSGKRQLHWVPHEHPPPSTPPLNPPLPPGAEVFAFPGGIIPAGWHMVPMWGGTHRTGFVYGQPDSHATAYARGDANQAAHILAPSAWATALADVLRDQHVSADDIHTYIVGDKVQFLVGVNVSTVDAVVQAVSGPYFESALSVSSHATIVGKGVPFVTYNSHGLVPDGVR
jgi:hypothetical protein